MWMQSVRFWNLQHGNSSATVAPAACKQQACPCAGATLLCCSLYEGAQRAGGLVSWATACASCCSRFSDCSCGWSASQHGNTASWHGMPCFAACILLSHEVPAAVLAQKGAGAPHTAASSTERPQSGSTSRLDLCGVLALTAINAANKAMVAEQEQGFTWPAGPHEALFRVKQVA